MLKFFDKIIKDNNVFLCRFLDVVPKNLPIHILVSISVQATFMKSIVGKPTIPKYSIAQRIDAFIKCYRDRIYSLI